MNAMLWLSESTMHIRLPFELNDALKGAVPGAKWDPTQKAYTVPASPNTAADAYRVLSDCRISVDSGVAALLVDHQRGQTSARYKTEADLPDIPGKTTAWEHQRQAYWFSVEQEASMLAMDMGTGKSRVAIGLLEGWDAKLALILCPKSVMDVWPNQFAVHAAGEWDVHVASARQTIAKRVDTLQRDVGLSLARGRRVAVVVNYEASWRKPMDAYLTGLQWDVVTCDEIHRIKSPGGKQSKFAAKLRACSTHRLGLTGTPMPHSPLDVYAQYRFLDTTIYGTSFARFRSRYAIMGGYEGRQVVGYHHEADLAERFGRIAYVCKSDEVLRDLPEFMHVERRFDLTPKVRAAYNQLDKELILGIEEGVVTAANALVKLLRLAQVTSGYVRDDDGVDHQVGTEKIDLLADVLEDIPTDEPVVIFARFKHDLAAIRELCEKQGRRVGELSSSGRDALNENAQMSSEIDVAVVQIQSGGVGIDLTRARYAIYYSLDYSLGNFEQSLKRVHRPGQDRKVTYIHLIARSTKDEAVYKALSERKNVVEAVIAASRETTTTEAT